MSPGPPFASLNLRRNPFGALDDDELAVVAVVDLEPWVQAIGTRLASPGGPSLVVQLVGPPGCGKTTHLAALARRFPRAARIAWSRDGGWGMLPEGEVLLADDAHMMPRRLLGRALARRVAVLATHRDLGWRVRRHGRDVRILDVPGAMHGRRVRELVRRRLAWARRDTGAVPEVDAALLERLLARHGPDLRGIVAALYDHIEDLRATA